MAIDYNVREEEPDLRSEEDCFPNIDPGVEILGDRVLVQLRREKTSSKGGILLVEAREHLAQLVVVVARRAADGDGDVGAGEADAIEPAQSAASRVG